MTGRDHTNPRPKVFFYDAQDRVVIFHADDLGMCQATVSASHDLTAVLCRRDEAVWPGAGSGAAARRKGKAEVAPFQTRGDTAPRTPG